MKSLQKQYITKKQQLPYFKYIYFSCLSFYSIKYVNIYCSFGTKSEYIYSNYVFVIEKLSGWVGRWNIKQNIIIIIDD